MECSSSETECLRSTRRSEILLLPEQQHAMLTDTPRDAKHVALVQSYYSLWKSLQAYIRQHYPTGLTWNNSPTGLELGAALKQVQAGQSAGGAPAPAPPAGGPPPPPPPPPLPNFDNAPPPPPQPAAKSGGAGDMGAVFDQLNRGEAVTAGLRKVDKSEMTHKNPSLRSSAPAMERSRSRGPETKPKPASMRGAGAATPKKEGKKELDGNKWIIVRTFPLHQIDVACIRVD